ncbi:cupin domain-containing protein [Neobacillus sp. SuZ13]|uniref:cupin domain-containing protein n=1 Tax=Neobacillus sp. SuZ13 TaxID=3047875 RepID=UPI0024BF7D48|nr:cupin domain-containing protein [Neobacillus sp. SuZ13]WHY69607.1 cupin domain-containing protein [Neobacillus sp. SuZ13]
MQLFKIGACQIISNYSSVSALYSKIIKTEEPTNIGFIDIEQGGIVGYHIAPVPQLFIVIQGEGWIEGEDNTRITLKSGEGVFWEKGEGHTSGSETGLTALVLQSEKLTIPSSLNS